MALFHIPFNADGICGWTILIPGDGEMQFLFRKAPLAFAKSLARNERSGGVGSHLYVERGDGQWRLFTPDLLPVG